MKISPYLLFSEFSEFEMDSEKESKSWKEVVSGYTASTDSWQCSLEISIFSTS
jgi:hypothetical protein